MIFRNSKLQKWTNIDKTLTQGFRDPTRSYEIVRDRFRDPTRSYEILRDHSEIAQDRPRSSEIIFGTVDFREKLKMKTSHGKYLEIDLKSTK